MKKENENELSHVVMKPQSNPPTSIKIEIFLQILGNPTLAATVNFATSARAASWELW